MLIETERLIIREVADPDLPALQELFPKNLDVLEYSAWKNFYPTSEGISFLFEKSKFLNNLSPRNYFVFSVIIKATGELISISSLFRNDLKEYMFEAPGGEGNIRIFIYKDHQGVSYSLEVLEALLNFGFRQLGLHRMICMAHVENIGLKKVLERCGFRQEGQIKEYLYQGGKWHDHNLYAILDHEWLKNNPAA